MCLFATVFLRNLMQKNVSDFAESYMKIIYYSDELNDDFGDLGIKVRPLRKKYKYVHTNIVWRFIQFIVYRIIAQPLVTLYMKFVFLHSYRNRKVLKGLKSGAYIYSNHTNNLPDVFIPYALVWHKKNYPIAGPALMSIKGINSLVEMLGAIPLASDFHQMGEMRKCIFLRIKQKAFVTIYPEAHVWPYYTKIRPFRENSFHFPAEDGSPVFALTNCYKKRLLGKRPRIVTYIDGPFYPDKNLSRKENMKLLRNKCYEAMCRRAEQSSTYEYIHYEKVEKN